MDFSLSLFALGVSSSRMCTCQGLRLDRCGIRFEAGVRKVLGKDIGEACVILGEQGKMEDRVVVCSAGRGREVLGCTDGGRVTCLAERQP